MGFEGLPKHPRGISHGSTRDSRGTPGTSRISRERPARIPGASRERPGSSRERFGTVPGPSGSVPGASRSFPGGAGRIAGGNLGRSPQPILKAPPSLHGPKKLQKHQIQIRIECYRIPPLIFKFWPSKYHAPVRLQNANPREFTRFKPLRPSKYHAPVRLQNANSYEFTRFRHLRPSKHKAPERR